MRFGRLLVSKRAPSEGRKHAKWICFCDCGQITTATSAHIRAGRSTSCGCVRSEMVTKKNTTHGKYFTKTHRVWNNMLNRCRCENTPRFEDYGGRGIAVCDRWLSFSSFLEDMGECKPGMSIDRIDVNGNYEPSNCRWATNTEQCNNKRNNRRIVVGGESMTCTEAARKYGLNRDMIRARLNRGLTGDEAIFTPSRYGVSK